MVLKGTSMSPSGTIRRPETVYSIEALYAMIDEQTRNIEIEDVPVRFTVRTSPPMLVLGPQYG
jgi:hypothetical protein